MELFIGIILLVAAVFLIASILLQSSKSHKLPGTISGGAETFFGKTKGKTIDRVLSKVTTIVAIVFCVLVVALFVMQDQTDFAASTGTGETTADISNVMGSDTTDAADTTDTADTADTADTTDVVDAETTDAATDAPEEEGTTNADEAAAE